MHIYKEQRDEHVFYIHFKSQCSNMENCIYISDTMDITSYNITITLVSKNNSVKRVMTPTTIDPMFRIQIANKKLYVYYTSVYTGEFVAEITGLLI